MSKKFLGIAILVLVVVATGLYFLFQKEEAPTTLEPTQETIGKSVEGRDIKAFTYTPVKAVAVSYEIPRLLFVGGIHGGYEKNSVALAYEFMDYLNTHPDLLPDDIIVTVIPSANPDGLYKVTGSGGRFSTDAVFADTSDGLGRFNSHDVDLNRNFDCKWQEESMWRGNVVSAGSEAFSEPEARAVRFAVMKYDPDAVIFWHSQANAVYASECEDGILPDTLTLMNTYAEAAGYNPVDTFDAYEVTGDAEGWLASIGIPAITVELSNHESLDWDKNLAGVEAVFDLYSKLK